MGGLAGVVHLSEAADPAEVGHKAARLGRLARAGFDVPPGVVLTAADGWEAALAGVVADLGGGMLAVRSSATTEDLTGSSWAGQYETVLGVDGMAAAVAAVARVRASAASERVRAYGVGPGRADIDPSAPIPVIVQRQVEARAAGLAVTADPLTGDRSAVVVTAVAGLGDRLADGRAVGDEWRVGPDGPSCTRAPEGALSPADVVAVAGVARRVAECLGREAEIEWALAGEQVVVLQARPLTAHPEPVDWSPPRPGGWLRNFRIGEWLPGPVTPLFDSWFLPLVEERFAAEQRRDAGFDARRPLHVTVNGWYFHSPFGSGGAGPMLWGMLRRPRLALASAALPRWPALTDRLLVTPHARRWREQALPRYRQAVARAEAAVETAGPDRLIELVEELAGAVGEQLWAMVMGGGSAWKAEVALARVWDRHLAGPTGTSHQGLLCGLSPPPGPLPDHAVLTLDWATPTWGELDDGPEPAPPPRAGAAALAAAARRRELEAEADSRLRGRSRRRFQALLSLAQPSARLREEQAGCFTLAWPVLRHAVLRLGEGLAADGAVAQADDVFFLTRAELGGGADYRSEVASRRRSHAAHQRLVPPLQLGRPPRIFQRLVLDAVDSLRPPAGPGAALVTGQPASPGRATGRVRVVRDAAGLDALEAGEVLVVAVPAPAWTAAFGRAAAVVSDGGSLAAHASLVAREYGIPAVVATGDATTRLRTGQTVTVDGTRGTVEPAGR